MNQPPQDLDAKEVTMFIAEAIEDIHTTLAEYTHRIETDDQGTTLVLYMADGRRFQVTVSQIDGSTFDAYPSDDRDAFLEDEFLNKRVSTPDGRGVCIRYYTGRAAVDLDEGGTWEGLGEDIQLLEHNQ
jgi:hypothetical protein